jgi:hypothetical protein
MAAMFGWFNEASLRYALVSEQLRWAAEGLLARLADADLVQKS